MTAERWSRARPRRCSARTGRADALVLGPGLGRDDATVEFARTVAAKAPLPLLLDADGLNAHAGRLSSLARRPAATVMTPHAGELARLLQSDSAEVGARRLDSVRRAAAEARAVVLLKGDDTLVAEPSGRVGVSRGGAPALATAGTGDVLSGLIGAYLSKGMDPFTAACAGALVHARAGRLLAREIGPEGVIAGDVIAALPRARATRSRARNTLSAMPLRAIAHVNLSAIERNAARLQAGLAEGARLCAVVKADGYGHGAVPAAAAALAGGAGSLAVATADEAARAARRRDRGTDAGDGRDQRAGAAGGAGRRSASWWPGTSGSSTRSRAWPAADAPVRLHVKLDTRDGPAGHARRRRGAGGRTSGSRSPARRCDLAGVMTHFATADDDQEFVAEQLEAFEPFVARAAARSRPDITVHAANSAATLRVPASHFDMVRCGIALYGCDPMNDDPAAHGLEPALALRTYVAAVKPIAAGRQRRIRPPLHRRARDLDRHAADRLRRRRPPRADQQLRRADRRRAATRWCGTVSMDNITVDVGPEPRSWRRRRGDADRRDGAERQTAEDLARRIGTINYEVLCGISRRVPRVYHRDGSR